jgi:hypothetical protein
LHSLGAAIPERVRHPRHAGRLRRRANRQLSQIIPARVANDSPKKAGKRKEAFLLEKKNQKTFTYQGQHLICPFESALWRKE